MKTDNLKIQEILTTSWLIGHERCITPVFEITARNKMKFSIRDNTSSADAPVRTLDLMPYHIEKIINALETVEKDPITDGRKFTINSSDRYSIYLSSSNLEEKVLDIRLWYKKKNTEGLEEDKPTRKGFWFYKEDIIETRRTFEECLNFERKWCYKITNAVKLGFACMRQAGAEAEMSQGNQLWWFDSSCYDGSVFNEEKRIALLLKVDTDFHDFIVTWEDLQGRVSCDTPEERPGYLFDPTSVHRFLTSDPFTFNALIKDYKSSRFSKDLLKELGISNE